MNIYLTVLLDEHINYHDCLCCFLLTQVVNITNNLTDTWKRMGVPSLKLPSPNQYIPTNLHILPTPANPQNKPIKLIQSKSNHYIYDTLHDHVFGIIVERT